MKGQLFLMILGIGGMLIACAPMQNKSSSYETNEMRQVASEDDPTTYLRLVDYLRGVPGLSVQGNGENIKVIVRNAASFNADVEPLYVINSTPVGQSYQTAAAMVDPNDISNVRVLRDVVSTAPYGMRGSNGVIVIKVKNTSHR